MPGPLHKMDQQGRHDHPGHRLPGSLRLRHIICAHLLLLDGRDRVQLVETVDRVSAGHRVVWRPRPRQVWSNGGSDEYSPHVQYCNPLLLERPRKTHELDAKRHSTCQQTGDAGDDRNDDRPADMRQPVRSNQFVDRSSELDTDVDPPEELPGSVEPLLYHHHGEPALFPQGSACPREPVWFDCVCRSSGFRACFRLVLQRTDAVGEMGTVPFQINVHAQIGHSFRSPRPGLFKLNNEHKESSLQSVFAFGGDSFT